MGRRLESATRPGSTKVNYTYNANGLITSKTKGSLEYKYYWNGDKLTAQTDNGSTWYFRYDGDTPIGLEFNGVEYYYVTNLQGDVIAILNDSGECVAEYSYDAWGNCTVTNYTDTIAYDNPLRYRGYYYDFDTGLYYLQSRFYDAKTGRFINADEPTLIGANGGMVSNNLFAYCDNNPVMNSDPSGCIVVSTVVKTIINAISGYFVGKAIANYFHLKGWKRKVCIGASSLLMTVVGYFAPVSIYNAIKAAISATATAYLTKKGYTLSRDMFNHAIYGYGKAPGSKITNNMKSKLKASSVIRKLVRNQILSADKNKKTTFSYKKIVEFKSGDLHYSIQHATVKVSGKKANGKWTITVNLEDTYDFTEFSRTFIYGLSVGNLANDLGYVM